MGVEGVATPMNWVADYLNVWYGVELLIIQARKIGSKVPSARVVDFLEHTNGKTIEGIPCDETKIPMEFIYTTNRLVKAYNSMIQRKDPELRRLERIIGFAYTVIRNTRDNLNSNISNDDRQVA